MNKKFLVFALSGLFLTACGGENAVDDVVETVEETLEETCTYTYNPDETILTWTGFKLTEKIGVSGTFDQINVKANEGATDMFGALVGASFNIPVSTTNSQDEVRDPKIKKNFFGVMADTEEITGMVKSLDATGGKVEITMNGTSVEYDGEVKVEGEEITFLTSIDLLDFDAQASIDSLGVVCEAKHTGPDGINKLWSDVDIAVKTTLTKACK